MSEVGQRAVNWAARMVYGMVEWKEQLKVATKDIEMVASSADLWAMLEVAVLVAW